MERFGNYVLLERVATGGMAEVYRAVAVGTAGFSRQVAIKRILPHLTENESVTTMLVEEAKIASTLSHPNIIRITELGREKDTYFIAMDFVAGQPLSQLCTASVRSGVELPVGVCFHIVHQALQGLQYAHQRKDSLGKPMGLIHRDISPQNIMVTYDGAVLLVDFGIAKAAHAPTKTLAGGLKGKPGYMSPEVVRGKPATQSLDVYAMGIVLYELLARRPMREAENDYEMLDIVREGTFTPLNQLRPDLPADVVALVHQALAPSVDDRWPDTSALLTAVEHVMGVHGWRYGAPQVAALLTTLFPDEIAKEEDASRRFHPVIEELMQAGPDDIARILRRLEPGTAPPASRRTWVLAAAALSAVVGIGVVAAVRQDTPSANPVVDQPPEVTPVPASSSSAPPAPSSAAPASSSAPVAAVEEETPRSSRRHKSPKGAGKPGQLTLTSRPWARVFIDGKDTGKFTPLVEYEIPAGKHDVKLVNDATGLSATFQVTIRAGATVEENRELR